MTISWTVLIVGLVVIGLGILFMKSAWRLFKFFLKLAFFALFLLLVLKVVMLKNGAG